jgi:guanine deaminase
MFESARLASFISRVLTPDYCQWLAAVLLMATEGSAQVLGWSNAVGRIAKDYKADRVFLDLGHINYVPRHDKFAKITFTENGGAVDCVMIGGHMVLDHGRLTTMKPTSGARPALLPIVSAVRTNQCVSSRITFRISSERSAGALL